AVQFPIVVLSAAAIYAKTYIACDANLAFILSGLVTDTRNEGHELCEVPPIKLQLRNLPARHNAGQVGTLSFYLGDLSTLHDDFGVDRANGHLDVNTCFLANVEFQGLCGVGLETGSRDDNVVGSDAKSGNQVFPIRVAGSGTVGTLSGVVDCDLSTGDDGASIVANSSRDLACHLCK